MSKPRSVRPRDPKTGRFTSTGAKPVNPSKGSRIERKTARLESKIKYNQVKSQYLESQDAYRKTKRRTGLSKGGIAGAWNRHRDYKRRLKDARVQAKVDTINLKPEMERKAASTAIQTKADVSKAKAKYSGYAAVASALGGGYSTGKIAEAAKAEKESDATKKVAETLENFANNVPQITSDDVADKGSVAGLKTGVR